jgi:serine/threonine protein kinase
MKASQLLKFADENEVSAGRWVKGKQIAKGAFGKVYGALSCFLFVAHVCVTHCMLCRRYTGLNTKNGHTIAIKEMKLNMKATPTSKAKKASEKAKADSKKDGKSSDDVGTNELIANEVTAEISLMQMLEHPSIVRFLGSEIDKKEDKLYCFLEFVSGGSVKCKHRRSFDFSFLD